MDLELLSPVRHRGSQAQADLAVLRSRDSLVWARTLLINHARGLVKSFGGRLPGCSADGFAVKVDSHIPLPLRPALVPVLETIAALTGKIHAYDQRVETVAPQRYPETQGLRRIQGMGPLTSLGYVLTPEDPRCFPKSRLVGAYVGLVPRRRQSSDSDPRLHINKCGDTYPRRLLVGSAQCHVGHQHAPSPGRGHQSADGSVTTWVGMEPSQLDGSPRRPLTNKAFSRKRGKRWGVRSHLLLRPVSLSHMYLNAVSRSDQR